MKTTDEMNDDEYLQYWHNQWNEQKKQEEIAKQLETEHINKFAEGSVERELKAGFMADEAARKKARDNPW